MENCFLLAKYACPPLVSKKLQAPPGDSFAYYYRPPLAEGQGGVWDLQANAAPTWGRRPRKPMGWTGGPQQRYRRKAGGFFSTLFRKVYTT